MGFFGGGGSTKTTVQPQSSMSPQQEEYLRQIMPYQLENARIQTELAQQGSSALTKAVEGAQTSLPDVLQISGAERALPGATGRAVGGVMPGLKDSYNYLGGVGNDPRISQLVEGLATGPRNQTLDSVLASLAPGGMYSSALAPGGSLNTTQAFSTRGITSGSAPTLREHEIDPNVLLKPLETHYRENVMPGVTAEAMRSGALGGSASNRLTADAAGKFGAESASVLAQNKASLMNAAANILGAETGAYRAGTEAETSAANLELQNLIGQRKLGLEATGLGIESAGKAGNLAMALEDLSQRGELGAGQLLSDQAKTGVMAASQRSAIANQLVAMGMSEAQAEAALAQAERGMGLQRAQVPLNLANVLMSGATGIPSLGMPFSPMAFPGGTTTSSPSAAGDAGAALSTIMSIAGIAAMFASSEKLKRDIHFETGRSYLSELRDIPLAEWNYRWDPPGHPRRVGPIREYSPEQIRGPGLTMNPLGYAGMLHAGLKELDAKVGMLEAALSKGGR